MTRRIVLQSDGLAHFQVCDCSEHEKIVFPDGRAGGEIASKENAPVVLQYVVLVDKFQRVDIFPERKVQHIMDEIEASTLPDKNSEVGAHTEKAIRTWNTAKAHQPNLNPADFHKVEDQWWHYRAYDD